MLNYFENAHDYYATTRSYAQTAFAGWDRDPRVSDDHFVIAAYQASQVIGIGTNPDNWALIFGAERLQKIENDQLRRAVANLRACQRF